MEQGSLSRVTVGEGLIPNIESSFLWFANIKVTHDYANGVRIQRPVRGNETQSFALAPQGKLRLEADVLDH